MQESSRNRIALNVISSAIQVIIVGVVYFFIYRILVMKLGVELLGVWSLIIATTSISNLANFGFTSALVKFVAEYNAKGELVEVNRLLFTSFFSMMLLFIFVSLIVYVLAFFFIDELVDLKYIKVALSILPLSLLCLFINSLGAVFTSALDGFQQNFIRNFIYTITAVCYLILAILLIPEFGLVGLAIAQVVQSLMIFIISYYFLSRNCRSFSLIQWNWDRKLFNKLFNYGYKTQLISITQMLIDPITKVMISRFSGISTLGFYEMASRLIIQLRQIIVNMNQVTIPIVSHYFQTDKSAIKYVYERGLSFIIFIVFPLVSGIILFTPYLSRIWIGNVEPVFINCSYILALSMIVNILCTPAYFNSFGEGNLNGVLFMNILIVILTVILGLALGRTIPVYGVAIAWGISTAIGSVFLIWYYQKRNNFNFRNLLKASDYVIIISAIIFSILSRFVFLNISNNLNYSIKSFVWFLIIYFVFFIPVAYFNRNFKLLNVFQYFKRSYQL